MPDLQSRFVRFARAGKLIRRGDRVLVALSGGVDSVVLLHLLRACGAELHIDVRAAHFDHAMREDSAADADWVAGLCRAWQVPLMHERTTRPLYGEADARNERYRFLHDALRESGATRIATAHHADDQIETVLFRLLRGTGLRGLAGIPMRRGRLIRPLLRFAKVELLEYAAQHHIQYRNDPTNEQLDFARNRIRKNVLPALETVSPHTRTAVLALARQSARTEAAIQSALERLEHDVIVSKNERVIQLARPVLLEYHPELRALVLRRALRTFAVVPSRVQTRRIVEFCEKAESGALLPMSGGVRLERAFDQIRIERTASAVEVEPRLPIVGTAGRASLSVGGARYDVAWNLGNVRSADAEQFDALLADHGLELRAWQPGDRIQLPYGSKKLKKLFSERRIPASQRTTIPVLADQTGRVLWVVGVVRAVDAPPADGPALNITVTNAELR